MPTNPVEDNPVTAFILGLAVIAAMFLAGGAVGWLGGQVGVPYGDVAGVAVGALATFVVFALLYSRYLRRRPA